MINNVSLSYRRGILIWYERDGQKDGVPYSEIKKIWNNLTLNSIEMMRCCVFNHKLAFVIEVAQGQGGVLFVWDSDKKEIVHYSEASYCDDFLLLEGKIITMHEVTNFVTPYHIQLWIVDYGTKDIYQSGKRLYCKSPVSYDNNNSSTDNRRLSLNDNHLYVCIGVRKYLYSDDIHSIENQQPNPEYSFLYQKWQNQFDPGKYVMRGMIT